MNKKIIIAGNKYYGLSKSLNITFPGATFCSRSNGEFNFFNKESVLQFAELSLDYDVCIFCSYIPHFYQILLLEKVWNVWSESKKKGQMIVLGSTADNSPRRMLYSIEKRALRDFCRVYGKSASGGGPELYKGNGIRITYVAPGMLDLPKQLEKHGEKIAKLDTGYLSDIIKWLVEQPDNINIYDISMDPVQQ